MTCRCLKEAVFELPPSNRPGNAGLRTSLMDVQRFQNSFHYAVG